MSSVPLQQSLRHQHAAFAGFYGKRSRYPRFKSRRSRQSASYTRSAFALRGGVLRLAKMEAPLRFVWSWSDVDVAALEPTSVTLAREPCGRWYATLHVEVSDPARLPAAGARVGVDLGVRTFATSSDGERIANPRHLERKARNLARYQRRLARCRHGPANRAKAKAKVARAISDCGWGEFRRQLEYRCQRYGRSLVVIDRWYPSSKTCSACGHRLASLSLGTRHWVCPSCRTRHDRDANAAKNILAAGLAVARGSPGDACGAGVRHSGSPRCAAGGEPGTLAGDGRNLHASGE